jgi:hypothetical protein
MDLDSDGTIAAGAPRKTLGQAALQIIVADVSMSLDNVLAVAGAAREHPWVLVFGLVLSIGLVGLAATIVAKLFHRHRWIAYVGLAVILYVALKMMYDGALEIVAAGFFVDWLRCHDRSPRSSRWLDGKDLSPLQHTRAPGIVTALFVPGSAGRDASSGVSGLASQPRASPLETSLVYGVVGRPPAIAVATALHSGWPQPDALTPGICPACGVMS